MPGYKLTFVQTVPHCYVCPLCRLPMRDAVKINSCNHKYCNSCLQDFLSKGIFICPKDKSCLEDTQIVADEKADEIVLSCRVSCPLLKDGCRWLNSLRDLENHQKECQFAKVACPRQCGVVVARRALENHMALVCPKRKIVCENCCVEFTGDAFAAHSLTCRRATNFVWCENKCGAHLDPSDVSHHELVCPRRSVACVHCGRTFNAEIVKTHEASCSHDGAPVCAFKEVGCSFEAAEGEMAAHAELACSQHVQLLLRMVHDQRAEIADLRSQLRGRSRVTNGVYVWRIEDFARRFAEAQSRRQRSEAQLELLSEAFYTGAPIGYKLQGSLFLDGNATGAGLYLSVYVKILSGDYDPLLSWPFTMSVTFTLLDQTAGGITANCEQNIESTFTPTSAWWKQYKRGGGELVPSEEDEPIGFGFPKFMSHAILLESTGRFVRRDKIFLQIKVDPPPTTDEEARTSRYSSI